MKDGFVLVALLSFAKRAFFMPKGVLILRIGIVGAGKVGTSLGLYFAEQQLSLVGFFSRTKEHGESAAKKTGSKLYSLVELLKEAELIWISVADDALEEVDEILYSSAVMLKGKYILHTSGLYSSSVLKKTKDRGAKVLSVHPLKSFGKEGDLDFSTTAFAVEGDWDEQIENWFGQAKFSFFFLEETQKPLYHTAAAICSNYLVSVLHFGISKFMELGYGEEFSRKVLFSLIEGTISNVKSQGTKMALTGPIRRGDVNTVRKHLTQLTEEEKELYQTLGRYTLLEVVDNNLDEQKKKELYRLLKGEVDV